MFFLLFSSWIHFCANNNFPFIYYRISTQQIAMKDRLTIYFHAILSKDFKFDSNEDKIVVRAGGLLSDWKTNLGELCLTRYIVQLIVYFGSS